MNKRAFSLVGLLLVGTLMACQGGLTGQGTGDLTAVSGEIVMPPAAGVAEFMAFTGQGSYSLAKAAVDRSGHFALNLPGPSRFSAQANTNILPVTPSAELVEFKQFSCPQRPAPSDPAARVVLVKPGSYRLNGRVTGQLWPASLIVGGASDRPEVVTTETHAYADRKVAVRGVLTCTLQRRDGRAAVSSTSRWTTTCWGAGIA